MKKKRTRECRIKKHLKSNKTEEKEEKKEEEKEEMKEEEKEEEEEEEEEKEEEQKTEKQKRKTKFEIEGRTHKCTDCNKSYLSYPALYTHCKSKHQINKSSGRGRGRPKKHIEEVNPFEEKTYSATSFDYFKKEGRIGTTTNFKKVIKDAFDYLYSEENENKSRINKRQIKMYREINRHTFFNLYYNDKHNSDSVLENKNAPIDQVLVNYLNNVAKVTNPEYFTKTLIFIVLFREHINQFNQDLVKYNEEYTTFVDAEEMLTSCNFFINDFLDPKSQDYQYSKHDAIEYIMNIASWLYKNGFTCTQLSEHKQNCKKKELKTFRDYSHFHKIKGEEEA